MERLRPVAPASILLAMTAFGCASPTIQCRALPPEVLVHGTWISVKDVGETAASQAETLWMRNRQAGVRVSVRHDQGFVVAGDVSADGHYVRDDLERFDGTWIDVDPRSGLPVAIRYADKAYADNASGEARFSEDRLFKQELRCASR
jgi:hypothetical protein